MGLPRALQAFSRGYPPKRVIIMAARTTSNPVAGDRSLHTDGLAEHARGRLWDRAPGAGGLPYSILVCRHNPSGDEDGRADGDGN